ncbi:MULTISPECIES: hypothetical protein [unclassified Lysobacter]|uniref:hypothetical protein n=1 Tax=unclassified Lysobacter TaxID=2635362 RepID=UPI001BE5D222|nr:MULTISPECIES: hypothetical protein [unclassified Lysobacter]MBT2745117.1 hypothetical protein [Lysobacter sp. ISL-42]MBT2750956.1 hypothetical protein [Lysobacter sp. ISL-50]MBT2778023.1 hypothetical protein [Lysobacter sp. ISL-54]MBT2783919.1 hypothetical protein [Lysobacter sp. ISL-52]
MGEKIHLSFLWVPSGLGGHGAEPYAGMRVNVRWQKHLQECLLSVRDAECTSLEYDAATMTGTAELQLKSHVDASWLESGALLELVNGYRVLAIGKIS